MVDSLRICVCVSLIYNSMLNMSYSHTVYRFSRITYALKRIAVGVPLILNSTTRLHSAEVKRSVDDMFVDPSWHCSARAHSTNSFRLCVHCTQLFLHFRVERRQTRAGCLCVCARAHMLKMFCLTCVVLRMRSVCAPQASESKKPTQRRQEDIAN